jgi:DNA-binding LytR/AlgR family response regulator
VNPETGISTPKFLLFNLGFWLLATLLLLLNAWSKAQQHWDVAILRYLYFLVIVLLVTSALTLVYDSAWFRRRSQRLALLAAISAVAALLTALLVNPLTYLMVGANIHAVPYEILSTGTLYFALFYFLWSVLFFQLRGDSEPAEPPPADRVFRVEKQGEQRQLHDQDICYVNASGDYVELITASNSYLHRDSLANLADQLDKRRFRRVHRSTIINVEKVESVAPKPGGAYEIRLDGGHRVQSSRSYKAVIEDILPPA